MLSLNEIKKYLEEVANKMEVNDYHDYIQAIDILEYPELCEPWVYDKLIQIITDLYNKYKTF